MRLFVALDLPNIIKNKIAKLRDDSLTGARWSDSSKWHITLHFIGERDTATAIIEAFRTVSGDSFELQLKGIGTFPEKGKPRVLWAGIDAPSALEALYQKVGTALKTTGFTPEVRPFKPHMTLARFRDQVPSQQALADYCKIHKSFETEKVIISEFILYQSELDPSGAVYTVIARFPLSDSDKA